MMAKSTSVIDLESDPCSEESAWSEPASSMTSQHGVSIFSKQRVIMWLKTRHVIVADDSSDAESASSKKLDKKPHRFFWKNSLLSGSLITWHQSYLRQVFISNNLTQVSVKIDPETTMDCWKPMQSPKRQKKPPLVLLHGFGSAALLQWDTQVSVWSQKFDLYIPDLVFFGGSFTTGRNRSLDFQASCVVALLDSLGVSRFDVLGFSYGGAICSRIAHSIPSRVRRVIIADEGIMMTKDDLVSMQLQLGINDEEGYWKLPVEPEDVWQLEKIAYRKPMRMPNVVYRDVLNVLFSRYQVEWRELLVEYTNDRPSDPTQNPKLEQKCLLIWGENDEMAPLKFGKMLQEHYGESCQLAVIRKGKHMSHSEFPREFNQTVSEFLTSEDGVVSPSRFKRLSLLPLDSVDFDSSKEVVGGLKGFFGFKK